MRKVQSKIIVFLFWDFNTQARTNNDEYYLSLGKFDADKEMNNSNKIIQFYI